MRDKENNDLTEDKNYKHCWKINVHYGKTTMVYDIWIKGKKTWIESYENF